MSLLELREVAVHFGGLHALDGQAGHGQTLGQIGVTVFQRLDNVHVIDYRALDTVVLTDCPRPDRPHQLLRMTAPRPTTRRTSLPTRSFSLSTLFPLHVPPTPPTHNQLPPFPPLPPVRARRKRAARIPE